MSNLESTDDLHVREFRARTWERVLIDRRGDNGGAADASDMRKSSPRCRMERSEREQVVRGCGEIESRGIVMRGWRCQTIEFPDDRVSIAVARLESVKTPEVRARGHT